MKTARVSIELAKRLRDIKFNWPNFYYWVEYDINDPDFKYSGLPNHPVLYGPTLIGIDQYTGREINWNNYKGDCKLSSYFTAPTLDDVQKWLREERGIDIEIRALVGMLHVKAYVPYVSIYKPYELSKEDKAAGLTDKDVSENNLVSQKQLPITCKNDNQLITAHTSFSIYEDAQRAAIDIAIEILLKKKEN